MYISIYFFITLGEEGASVNFFLKLTPMAHVPNSVIAI
jgi:hypothetical protein